jgi:3-deoxy-7-phosphoheptulonate synthase
MSRTPLGDRHGDRTGHRLRPVSHDAFRDPVTRMLLSSDGSTTRLLEATVGPLRLRVLHQAVGTAARSPGTIRTALGLTPEAQIINRCSALVDAQERPVSLNHVVAPFVPHSRLGDIVSGTAAGIGPELARQHVQHRRELLACGLALWPHAPAPRLAAAKVYVIWQGEERLMYIREMFHPDVIPAATAAAVLAPSAEQVTVRTPAPGPGRVKEETASPMPVMPAASAMPATGEPMRPGQGGPAARRSRLETMPGLVTPAETEELRATLALAAAGRGFVVQVGDGTEVFDRCTQEAVQGRHALIRLLATAAGYGMGVPVAAVGPLPAHRGDPALQAYLHSAAVLHALRNADQQADVRWIRWLRDELGRRGVRHPQAEAVIAEMDFALQFGASGAGWPRTFVAHEALTLDYERALVRADDAGRAHGSSGHLPWIGEHTSDPAGAHVAFAASIANPVAVRPGPQAEPEKVLDLCRRINPEREAGRLALIVGPDGDGGAQGFRKSLPSLLRAVDDAEHPVVWICDPTQVPHPDDVFAGITAFFDAHADAGTHPGGLCLEAAAEDVAPGDPRLHPLRALECVLHAVALASQDPRAEAPAEACDPVAPTASGS